MRLADYVAATLADHGVHDVFMVTGGAAMHLNDAFGRSPALRVTCFHHEQGAAIAAEGYFRTSNRLAAVNVSAGPASTNALTGVLGAWDDSVGMLVISGQPKRGMLVPTTGLGLRQFGEQELDIVAMVAGITKYAVQVLEPADIRYHLERALHLSTSGRPGPVWIDIPADVQALDIDPGTLRAYDPAEDRASEAGTTDIDAAAEQTLAWLAEAERPVLFVGPDLHLSDAGRDLRDLIHRLGVPVVTAINGHDLVDWLDPHLIGRPGLIGDRAGNLAVQNADLVLVLGTRLPTAMSGYEASGWAPFARVVMVDADAAELAKPTIHVELAVHGDAGAFIRTLAKGAPEGPDGRWSAWLAWCQDRRARYPVVLPEYLARDTPINPYVLFPVVFDGAGDTDVFVTGNAWAGNGAHQAAPVRLGQRLFCSIGCGSMGHDLPAAIGATIASGRTVNCIPGDGSLQMNIQELQTVAHHRLPVKIFVLDNGGYSSIRQSQRRFFPDGPVGFDPTTGISFPDLSLLAPAYGLPFRRVTGVRELRAAVRWAQETDGPTLVQVIVDPTQDYAPKSTARILEDGSIVSAPLEDMAPFLPRDEVEQNMAPSRGSLRV